MVGQNQVRSVADPQPISDLDSRLLDRVQFVQQGFGIHHHAVADDRDFSGPKNAAGKELQNELLSVDDHRVAGIGSALIAGHDVKAFRQRINNFPFTFVSPLNADDHRVSRHTGPVPSPLLLAVYSVSRAFTFPKCGRVLNFSRGQSRQEVWTSSRLKRFGTEPPW